eukprot:4743922-Prymnesium_polylepis.1
MLARRAQVREPSVEKSLSGVTRHRRVRRSVSRALARARSDDPDCARERGHSVEGANAVTRLSCCPHAP